MKARVRRKGRIEHNSDGSTTIVNGTHANHDIGMDCWCQPYIGEHEDDMSGERRKVIQHRVVGNA